jgi:hypothetical protein
MGGTFPHPQCRIWLPDHFVPLLGNYQISSRGKTSSPVTVDIPSPTFVQSPLKATPTSSECDLIASLGRSVVSDCSQVEEESSVVEDVPSPITESGKLTPPLTTSPSTISWPEDYSLPTDREMQDKSETSSVNEAQFETQSSETATTTLRDSKQNGDPNRNKLSGRFLDVEELCEVLQGDSVNSSSIPNGVKENTYFLIKNDKNVEKRKQKMRSNFNDDCGAWLSKSSSTKKTLFYCVDQTV